MTIADSLVGRTVAILGGAGPEGRGLARRFAVAGLPVVVGSRSAERAAAAAAELSAATGAEVRGAGATDAVRDADLVVVAVSWDDHAGMLHDLRDQLAGKIVVDTVCPIALDDHGPYLLHVWEGSAAQQAQSLLPASSVVGAFHHLPGDVLDAEGELDTDVLVVGDDDTAVDVVRDLVATIPGARGVYAGRLRSALQVEALWANLLSVEERTGRRAGYRVTGL
ncbi:MAG TPA: NADPH-dependent F420 reductase [Nocardioides sp.]|uniref:NADPH-dependent F420 reductase n=1 Tax=Nocardioides sp. TaxID=35761 RepID=UPI002EDB9900